MTRDELKNRIEDNIWGTAFINAIMTAVDEYCKASNNGKPPVSGSLPPTETQILDEAQKHYEDCGISYPDSLVYMANWALSFGGNDH